MSRHHACDECPDDCGVCDEDGHCPDHCDVDVGEIDADNDAVMADIEAYAAMYGVTVEELRALLGLEDDSGEWN